MPTTPISISAQRKDREPNGRKRRGGAREFMVYIGAQEGRSTIKVGRTHNARQRVAQFQRDGAGQFRFLSQIIVATREETISLERAILQACRAKHGVADREWVEANLADVRKVARAAIKKAGITILEIRGALNVIEDEGAAPYKRDPCWLNFTDDCPTLRLGT